MKRIVSVLAQKDGSSLLVGGVLALGLATRFSDMADYVSRFVLRSNTTTDATATGFRDGFFMPLLSALVLVGLLELSIWLVRSLRR